MEQGGSAAFILCERLARGIKFFSCRPRTLPKRSEHAIGRLALDDRILVARHGRDAPHPR
jgi:hypothetical protein